MAKVWLITGASQGFGLLVAKKALERGWKVAGTSRSIDRLIENLGPKTENFLPLAMQIKDDNDVKRAVDIVFKTFGRIDVLLNNAGYGQCGAFEEVSDEIIREQFDVNLFGTMNVTRHVLPIMRKQKSGVILNTSSMLGIMARAFIGIYSASKFAVLAFSQALKGEVEAFGIKVVCIMPGSFRTNFREPTSIKKNDLHIPDYDAQTSVFFESFEKMNHNQPGNPERAAQFIIDVSEMDDPPLQFLIGSDCVNMWGTASTNFQKDVDRMKSISISSDFPK